LTAPAVNEETPRGESPERPARSPWPRRLMHAAVLLVLAYLAYRFIDFRLLGRTLATTPPTALVLLLALATADRWLMAVKWRQLCRTFGCEVPLLRFVRIYYGSSFINYCIPSMIGGDLYRAVALGRDMPGKKEHVLASVAMEKVIAVFATIVSAWLGLAWLLWRYDAPVQRTAFGLLAAASTGAAVAIALSLHPGIHPRLARMLISLRLGRFAAAYERIYEAYLGFVRHRAVLARNLALAFVENGVQISVTFVAAWALRVDVPLTDLAAIIVVAQLVRRIAIYVEGKGLAEGLNVAMFGLVGVQPSVALAISLLGHAANILASFPGAFAAFLYREDREAADGAAQA
jgi:uncharacterized protein (TIRG00374 family)